MNIFDSILLGAIQGLTEFLPVSSSAHLSIVQSLIPHFSQPGLVFDVIIHMGTTLAVLIYFRKKLLSISMHEAFLLGVATIPAVLVGLLFREILEGMFSDIHSTGWQLVITGILNFLVVFSVTRSKKIDVLDSLLIGFAQAVAIVPGISRSGATIFTGVKLGIDKKRIAEFSFLMSVPAIVGANVLELYSHRASLGSIDMSYFAGFATAFIVGFISIGFLMKIITEKSYLVFAVYCIVLGLLTVALL